MAGESVLAREVIEFVAKGVEKVSANITSIGKAIMQPRASLAAVQGALDGFASKLSGVASLAGKISAVGAGAIGLLTRAALSNTVAGEQLGVAWEYLGRTLGSIFAPYVMKATEAIVGLANWFKNLDASTKSSVAQWALIAVGVAGFIALLPAIVAGGSAIIGIFGGLLAAIGAVAAVITSPISLVILGFGAAVIAATKAYDYFTGGSQTAADNMNEANKGWLTALVRGIGAVTVAFAKFFNFIAEKAAAVSDKLADWIAQASEAAGIVPKGTTDTLRNMSKIEPIKINIDSLDEAFKMAKTFAGNLEEKFSFQGLLDKLQTAKHGFTDALAALKQPGNTQLVIKSSVKFEGLQGTFDRLQQALAADPTKDLGKAQLGQLQGINEGIQKVLGEGITVKGINAVT